MVEIFNFPYNNRAVARLDAEGVVHNHLYHHCPLGRIDENNIIYNNDSAIGRIDENGVIHNHCSDNSPVGRVDDSGFIHNHPTNNSLVGRVEGNNLNLGGSAYLLLVHGNR